MKENIKKARRTRKAIKRAVRMLLVGCAGLCVAAWVLWNYVPVVRYLDRFSVPNIDTAEVDIDYNLLSRYQKPGKDLVLDLGVKDTDDLRVVLDKLKDVMGLGRESIGLAYRDEDTPPAHIEAKGDEMTISLSKRVKKRREQINLLTHELCHIYVWRLKKSIFGLFDQEKLVDCAGVFLGLGVLTLNGMTDEFRMLPDGSTHTEKKTFGYLQPEQFGYLLARYCSDRGIKAGTLKPFLNSAGWRYYQSGRAYLRKKTFIVDVPEPVLRAQSLIRRALEFFREKISEVRSKFNAWKPDGIPWGI